MVKMKPFPDLRGMLRKYGLTYTDYGTILGKTKNTAILKLDNKVPFTQTEMFKTVNYFKSVGETDVTADKLFFAWMSTIGDKEEVTV
jgi:hypothetical protein